MESTAVLIVRYKVVRALSDSEVFEVTGRCITREGSYLHSSSGSGLDITMVTMRCDSHFDIGEP